MKLDDKVCVVTGASSGIGRRTAIDLAARGARVCVVARRAELLEELSEEIGGERRGHSVFVADVSDRARVAELARHVGTAYGRCDVLVNSAGFSGAGAFQGEGSFEHLDSVMATNFFGAVQVTGLLLPLLERSAPSHVVNVASVAGRVAFGRASAYCASKFALVGWSEAVAFDLEDRGVSVGLIEPGPVPTEGFRQEDLRKHLLLRRVLVTDWDVARAILRLIETGKTQRIIPRLFHIAPLTRLLAPPVYRFAARKVAARRGASGHKAPS